MSIEERPFLLLPRFSKAEFSYCCYFSLLFSLSALRVSCLINEKKGLDQFFYLRKPEPNSSFL